MSNSQPTTASLALRSAIDNGDLAALRELLQQDSSTLQRPLQWGTGCPVGACAPLSYLAQARFHGFAHSAPRAEIARTLIEFGAPVDGDDSAKESPLITAASYNDPDVAAVLVRKGADLALRGYAVADGTALSHAVHFGAPEIAALLVQAGARPASLWEAAGAGALGDWLTPRTLREEAQRAFRAAAVCARLDTMEALIGWGVDANDWIDAGTALHWAAWEAKAESVMLLLRHGANPSLQDPRYQMTALGWARYRSKQAPHAHPGGHHAVIEYLESLP